MSFGVLEDDEPCCGEAVLSLGHKQYFQEVAKHAAQTLNQKGVEHVLVISPHCYDAFKNRNQFLDERITVTHYTTLIAGLIDTGRLQLTRRA